MKKELKPLKVGDRVKIYDAASYSCPMRGVVTNASLHMVDVRTSTAGMWSGYQKQVRKIRPPKAKPERERMVKNYLPNLGMVSRDCPGVSIKLVEIREGEQVISKEALAAAWDLVSKRYGLNSPSNEGEFKDFLQALGFPVSTKGEA